MSDALTAGVPRESRGGLNGDWEGRVAGEDEGGQGEGRECCTSHLSPVSVSAITADHASSQQKLNLLKLVVKAGKLHLLAYCIKLNKNVWPQG